MVNKHALCLYFLCFRYYNSRLDLAPQIDADYPDSLNDTEKYDAETIQASRLTSLATALARYLFWAAMGRDPTASEMDSLQGDLSEVLILHFSVPLLFAG